MTHHIPSFLEPFLFIGNILKMEMFCFKPLVNEQKPRERGPSIDSHTRQTINMVPQLFMFIEFLEKFYCLWVVPDAAKLKCNSLRTLTKKVKDLIWRKTNIGVIFRSSLESRRS